MPASLSHKPVPSRALSALRLFLLTLSILAALPLLSLQARLIYHETFSGPDLPPFWHYDSGGEWAIKAGGLDQSRLSAYTFAWVAQPGAETGSDFMAETRFQIVRFGQGDSGFGFLLPSGESVQGGQSTRVSISLRGHLASLDLIRPGRATITLPLNQILLPREWYTLKAEIHGSSQLKVWVNDTQFNFGDVLSGNNIIREHPVGIWTQDVHVRFDDLKLYALEKGSLFPEPATALLFTLGLFGFFIGSRIGERFSN